MPERPDLQEAYLREVVERLRSIEGLLARLVASLELTVSNEPSAASEEPPGNDEPFSTWILTDALVARVEDAVLREQEVRGRAYGGPHG